MASGKSKDDEIYERGVHDGQGAGFLDQVSQVIAKGLPHTREGEIYDKGYEYGRTHQPDSSNSSAASGSADDSGGGCYISTACAHAVGLPNDSYELSVLRKFRDEYVARLPNGADLIARYYANAPRVLAALNAKADACAVLRGIFADLVAPSVALIEAARPQDALDLYLVAVSNLEREHLKDMQPNEAGLAL